MSWLSFGHEELRILDGPRAGHLAQSVSVGRHWMLFRLAATTGTPRGELQGLRWFDYLDIRRLGVTQPLTAVGSATSAETALTPVVSRGR